METLFLVCAVVGGVILLCQFAMTMLGLGGEHDGGGGDHHVELGGDHGDAGHGAEHGATWFFHALSLRSLVAAVTFFGLGGLAAASSTALAFLALPIGLMAGALAMVVVAWLLGILYSLQSQGNVRIEAALGIMGTVYLTIPPKGEGVGKVTVKIQNRTMEYRAISEQDTPLKTGTAVMVVGIPAPDTVEVAPTSE